MRSKIALVLISAFAVIALFTSRQERVSSAIDKTEETQKSFAGIEPVSMSAASFAVSAPVRTFAPAQPNDGTTTRKLEPKKDGEVKNKEVPREGLPNAKHDEDAAIARMEGMPAMPSPSLSFEGLNSTDNSTAYGFRTVPPDVTGDIGPNHYVQAVNLLIRVYDKSGNAVTPPFKMSSLFAPLGTICASRNDGDTIVLYDPLADRWLISQFCMQAPPFRQMIAISMTGDPTGSYFIYEFVMPNNLLNDYPKFGVWSNGYYMTDDQFIGSDFQGTGVFAFERAKMLTGDPTATYIYFNLPAPLTRIVGMLPADLDGLRPPPANSPHVFAYFTANEYGDPADAVRLFNFTANFSNPTASTFTERSESPIALAAFDPTSPAGRGDIPQEPPNEALDSQSDRLMFRLAYRNLGTHEALVFNHTVRVSPQGDFYRAGVRYYELRRTSPTGAFTVHDQTTFAPGDQNRWMGSVALDHQGNLAVGYSSMQRSKFANIRYTGRAATDPPGTSWSEAVVVDGTGGQNALGGRWGDYTTISVDPADDCSFWFTNEYYTQASANESPFGWLTRIAKFSFPSCTPAPKGIIQGTVTNASTNAPLSNARITADAYTRTSNANGSYGAMTVLPGGYTLMASLHGYNSSTATVNVANGANVIQNFQLAPIAVIESNNVVIVSESCPNGGFDPLENVIVNLSLRNTGAANTTNLTATLQPTGGVMTPGAPQSFGTLIAGGSSVARPFSFTVSPSVPCGGTLTLTLNLQDGATNLGTVTFNLRAGKERVVLQENFDNITAPALPNGWMTATTGGQQVWKTVTDTVVSTPNAGYSAASFQIGINELVSPVVHINSNQPVLTFKNKYDLESTFLRNILYDGGVLEIKIGGNDFQDIITAGGSFVTGGYDGPISDCCQNPLQGRQAWSSKSGIDNNNPSYITTKVNLPASAQNQDIQLRWRVGTDIGTSRPGQWIDDVVLTDGYSCCQIGNPFRRAVSDFDGDLKTDLAVYRPQGGLWYVLQTLNNQVRIQQWGVSTDTVIEGDFDGDFKTDFTIYRPQGGLWYILQSATNTIRIVQFGGHPTDQPVPADYDGDGKTDFAIWRPGTKAGAEAYIYILKSIDNSFSVQQWGTTGIDRFRPADYDGDGRADIAVYREAGGLWYILQSATNSVRVDQFGIGNFRDIPVPADYDGDGRSDLAVFRKAQGIWYINQTTQGFRAYQFGVADDIPVPGDFDGDIKADIAVWRPSTGVWYVVRSVNGSFFIAQFGLSSDVPIR